MQKHHRFAFPLTTLAAALLAAFGPARAEEADEVKLLIKPDSELSVGLGYVDNENQRWGKYTGMTDNGAYGLLDFNIVNRDDETGTWVRVLGRNLGLDNREFRFEHNRQGDWGYLLEYSQIPFNQPLTIITRTSGIGTPVQNVTGAAALPFAVPYELETRRDRFTVGAEKIIAKNFSVSARFRTEDKEGNRRYGRGDVDFLAEPIDWTTNQLDVVFGYSGEKLQLQAGYYGTTFDNSNSALWIGAPNFGNAANALGLPPDNQSHQGYLSGGYSFTPTTRANFKVSYSEYTQNEAFFTAVGTGGTNVPPAGPLSAIGRRSLDGKVDNTLAEVGIVSRPLPKLTLRADWRYEDREDKTPRLQYLSASASRDGFNVPLSRTTNIARGEAQYMLPMGFRAVGGIAYEQRDREITPTLRQISWREDTDEWIYRLELSRSLSETLNGRISYIYSDRDGSAYLPANNNADPDVIDPIHWADRKRDMWRLRLDWVPLEALSFQFSGDYADDRYDGRPLGPESGQYRFIGVDGTYVISDNWQVVGWVSHSQNEFNQRTIGNVATQPPPSAAGTGRQIWYAPQHNTTDAIGLGLRGRATAKLELGADLQYQEDNDEYNALPYSTGSIFLPEIDNKHTTLTLFGKYSVSANSGVKVEYVYDRYTTNDWAWQIYPFPVLGNGTLIYNESPQQVHFIGASYYYEWR